MEWMEKTNEMLVDFVKRGTEAYSQDISFLTLKKDLYLAISTLMISLADGKGIFGSKKSSESSTTNHSKALDAFKEEARAIFSKFEKGRSYKNSGIVETSIDQAGRRLHSTAYQMMAPTQLANVEKRMETLWSDFFALTNTGDAKSDTKNLDELLSAFEKDILAALAS